MPNIYQNIDSNKKDTVIIMFFFMLLISAIGYFVGEYFTNGGGPVFVAMAFIFSGFSSLFSYYFSDSVVLAISGAKEVSKEEAPDLHNLVENMSIASGIPKPRIFIIEDTSMNAFATGRNPQHSVICFTSGIVSRLEKRELEGVIAHEMSHIGNYDILLMSIVSVLVGSVTLLSDWFTRGMFYGSRRRSNNSNSEAGGILFILGFILVLLSPLIAALIKLALSRHREFLADANAALITRYPQGLANALRKLAGDKEILEAANGATAHLYIVTPLRSEDGFVSNLFNTHPPIEERIRRLESM